MDPVPLCLETCVSPPCCAPGNCMISLPGSEPSLKGVSSIRKTQMKTQGVPTPRNPSLGISEQIKEEMPEYLLWFCWWQAAKHQGSRKTVFRCGKGRQGLQGAGTHCWQRLGTHTALCIFFPPGTSEKPSFDHGWS